MTAAQSFQMGIYIWKILNASRPIAMSWGIDWDTVKAIHGGIKFHVQGFLHRGFVHITYDEGSDTFDVSLLKDDDTTEVKTLHEVYFDTLVDVIDRAVENTGEDYKDRIIAEYDLRKIS